MSEPVGSSGLPDTICPMPWTNLSIDVDGSSRPCCKFAHLEPESPYQMANLADAGIDDVWNSEAMAQLRTDFRKGDQPADCRTCWDEESAGIRSWRQDFLTDRSITGAIDYDDVRPAAPVALDLKLTNACNLKCRICGPVASSLWLHEQLKVATAGEAAELRANRTRYLSNKITQDDANLATFRSWIPHLQHIEMTGGEPMFSLENREVIELIVAEGAADQVSLLLTTNAMVIDDRIMRALPAFADVSIAMSVDDMGPRLEYERAPAEWATVVANMDTYAAGASATQHRHTNCSVSNLNAWYLPDFIRWHVDRYPTDQVGLHLNLVHNARCFNVQVMPESLKDSTCARLQVVVDDLSLPAYIRGQVAGLIGFVNDAPPDPDAWQELLATLDERDAIRDESFAATFPELAAEIDRLGLGGRAGPGISELVVPAPLRRLGRRLLHR